jgi:DNA-binding transcriptional ArsR family regulator
MTTPFEALAEPTRRRILDLIRERPRSVGELVELLTAELPNISQPGVSKHLRVLRDVGLVRVRQDAQRHWYELRLEPLAEINDWLGPYRKLLEERFERLDSLLDELQEPGETEKTDDEA